MSNNKKNDDIIFEEKANETFEFSEEPIDGGEISVQKPGLLEKRSKRGPEKSRAVVSEDKEYFDIE